MTGESASIPGVALLAGPGGRLLRVLRDEIGLDGAAEGVDVPDLVDGESRVKAEGFLAEVRDRGAAFGWELNAMTEGRVQTLTFAGGAAGDGLLLIAARTMPEVMRFYEELLRINNEQVDQLRGVMKEAAQPGPRMADGGCYDEISRLNNDLVNAQRDLAKKNAQLQAVSAQKDMFLGMAAHDLRNPLGAIMAFASFLEEDAGGGLDESCRAMLRNIRSSSRYMLQLIEDMLDISRIQAGRLELDLAPCDLAAEFDEVVEINRALASPKSISLRSEVPTGLPRTMADRVKIKQVLGNLLSNAIKFTHSGGRVDMDLRLEGARFVITVADDGQGIPADALEGIFEPFGKTEVEPTGGEPSTGLGLAIVKRVVEGHGGSIEVESKPGEGSRFTVRLPLVRPEEVEAGPDGPDDGGSGVCVGARVLLVEDEPLNRKLAVRLLDGFGCHTVEAADGVEALRALGEQRFDLVFMDLHMPGMDGAETVSRLRRREREEGRSRTTVLALTGAASQDDLDKLDDTDLDGRVEKPLSRKGLLATLRRHLPGS
ncbi:hybrid sensor histidine kinase/response regulator [Desulfohalovibrio reitneri]|uniref:hybrid sensor histidine kinase/response regulator n=1 Tax=Desulfohalovibrio reitneri TaxID=1307759 RepID=UPI0006892EF4|nr:hybrid sensor histidine kinase/response regulator [Desulfohalovibrio reitneri]